MNSRWLSNLLVFLLIAAMAYAYLARGAYARLYFIPLAAILILALAIFLTAVNHGCARFRAVPAVELPLLLFLGWAALSYFSSYNREATSFEVIRLASLIGAFFIAAHGLNYQQKIALLAAIATLGAMEAIYGIYQAGLAKALYSLPFLADPPRHNLSGTLVNKNHFAGLMEMSLFASLAFLPLARPLLKTDSKKIAVRALFSLFALLIALALIFALSRGGWISAAGGSLVFVALIWRESRMRSLAMVVVVAAVLLTGVFLFRLDTARLQKRIASLEQVYEGEELNVTSRFALWRSAAAMTGDHPLLGTGWGAFREAYPSYRRGEVLWGAVFAHNDYLQISAGVGLPGLIFFGLFAAMTLREGLKLSRHHRGFGPKLAPGIMAGLCAILIHEMVDFNLMLPANALVFFCLAGLVSSSWEESP